MAASVVRVHNRSLNFSGTGFVCYSDQGGRRCLVMTVAEAVAGSRRGSDVSIGLPNQRDTVRARVLYTDHGANLALLSFVVPAGQHCGAALPFANWVTADLNSGPVVVRGYYCMGRSEILLAPGVFRGDIRGDAVWRDGEAVHTVRCDYAAAHGLQGAPVIQAGSVIAVHTGSEGRLQVATSVVSVWSSLWAWLAQPPLVRACVRACTYIFLACLHLPACLPAFFLLTQYIHILEQCWDL